MKQFIQKLWISITMLCLSFTASAYDFEIDGICYNVIDPAELTCGVCATTESLDCSKEVVIPSQVSFLGKTLTVVSIMDEAFKFSGIVSISIPNTCTSIGDVAFYDCEALKSFNIPEGVTSIGDYVFQQSAITSLYISDSNQKLEFGSKAFDNSKIKDLYIGRELELNSYDNYALFYNADIDSLTIGSKVTKIGMEFFTGKIIESKYSVKSVQKLNILPSEESLYCEESSLLKVNPNVLILGRQLSVSCIFSNIFSNITNLKHLEIGENVNDISSLSLDRNNITTMLVKKILPPKCISGTFSKDTYLYCSLKVPVGSYSDYKSAEGWKNFWNIEECDFSGVEAIEEDNALSCVADNGDIRIENKDENSIVRVYNIQGSMLAETSESVVTNLPKGLYIVTVENKSFKVSLR